MACRLVNRTAQPIRVDLRGGQVLLLAPGAMSPALPEEQLYDNMFLPKWEREGSIQRLPARFADVGAKLAAVEKKPARKSAEDKADHKKVRKSKGKSEN